MESLKERECVNLYKENQNKVFRSRQDRWKRERECLTVLRKWLGWDPADFLPTEQVNKQTHSLLALCARRDPSAYFFAACALFIICQRYSSSSFFSASSIASLAALAGSLAYHTYYTCPPHHRLTTYESPHLLRTRLQIPGFRCSYYGQSCSLS